MGLLSALSNAVTGLSVNQQNLNVLSQNISNANTAGYSNEAINQQATYENGLGTGVSVESITRTVDQYLNAEVQSQTSVNSAASTTQNYYTQIENLLGQPGASDSIDSSIDSFFTTVQDLANTPSVSTETAAVNAGSTLATQVSGLATALQSLRAQSDSQISSSVASVNTDLQTLFTTNVSLERAVATNQPTSGLLDQRDAALADLAKYVDINPTYASGGEVTVSTTNGLTLLTPSTYSALSYSPASSASTFITNQNLSPIQITTLNADGSTIGNPVTLATGGASSSVTTSLVSGSISSLLTMRDSTIPNILNQLDQLASNLTTAVNAVTNKGSSSPPPNSYTGTTLVNASSPSQWSGSVQIALLNSTGQPAASPYSDETNGLQPLTLNLGSMVGSGGTGTLTASDIINYINQYYGTPQNKVELGNINNAQLGVLSTSVPAAGNTLNFDFNLNNISSNNASLYVSGVTVLDPAGTTVASSLAGTVTSTQPSLNVSGFASNASNTVTVSVGSTAGLTSGENVYLSAGATIGGQSFGAGYYTIGNITGSSFDITVNGMAGGGATPATQPTGVTALPPYSTVNSGQTVRTGSDGSFTISNLTSGPSAPAYYTVEANIATVDASGNVVTSTVSYNVPNNGSGTLNDLIGANSATGTSAKVVAPSTDQPQITASLVNAQGQPLTETNGSYGNQQGYIKITADNSSYTVAINELDSSQLGLPNVSQAAAGTYEGFSQYYGLNNFFTPNGTSPGTTVAGSAINMAVESRIVSNPSLIPTGTLSQGTQPAAGSASPPNFTYVVDSGDNSISQALAALANSNTNYALAGGMPASSTTFSDYAGQIIAKTSNDSTDATSTATDSQTLLSGYTSRASNVSGVNLDQELANTVIYQNAYSASARVISVVSTMFEQLLGIIQ